MNNEWKDYYLILELEFGATDEDIKKQYRKLAKKYHPDSQDSDEAKMREVNEAYSILSDAIKKQKYDETYEQCKTGNTEAYDESYNDSEEDEMPKYTHEEMHETFTEEEVRFAEKLAFQKVIRETVEKAKIIIDAKNELLFSAFMGVYSEEEYINEYNEFITLTNEYINNLNNLISEARKYDLSDEVNGIKEVIDFITECIKEIPKNLNSAKKFVKKELMIEQLKNETLEELEVAERNKNNFINFYRQVYEQKIDQVTFENNYNVLNLHIIDSLSKLHAIYDLLQEAKLDDEFKQVGTTIGSLTEFLKLYKKDYSLALKIGKRESVKAQIQLNILAYEEYKIKIKDIFKVVYSNPLSDNLYEEILKANALGKEFRNNFIKIETSEFSNLYYQKEAEKLFKKAFEIFQKSEEKKDKLHEIFKENGNFNLGIENIPRLAKNIENLFDDKEALKLLRQVYVLLGRSDIYMNLCQDNLMDEIDTVNRLVNKSLEAENILQNMYNYIQDIKKKYQNIGGDDYILNMMNRYKNTMNNIEKNIKLKNILENIGAFGFISECIYLLLVFALESISLDPEISLLLILSSLAMVLLSCIPKSKTEKYEDSYLEFKNNSIIIELYEELSKGTCGKLNNLYNRGMSL